LPNGYETILGKGFEAGEELSLLEKGRIAESGTHEELIQLDGTYAHLFEIQAQHYR
jgi:ATP-binding cassette subfamily B protein